MKSTTLAGEKIQAVLTRAPGNDQLRRILHEAQAMVDAALAVPACAAR